MINQVADVGKDPMEVALGLIAREMRDTRILCSTTLTTITAFNTPTGWTTSAFLLCPYSWISYFKGINPRCLYQYSLNEDVSQVTFKEFHQTEKDIYPSLTLCFGQFFFYDENKYGSNFTDEYSSYLTGDYWDDQMLQVDYDEVTFDINEYLLGLVMYTTDWRHINEEEYFGYDLHLLH